MSEITAFLSYFDCLPFVKAVPHRCGPCQGAAGLERPDRDDVQGCSGEFRALEHPPPLSRPPCPRIPPALSMPNCFDAASIDAADCTRS